MTTAARPTFEPAKGGSGRGEKSLSALSKQYSSRDLPSHLKIKYRQSGQGTNEELKDKDFRRELEERERKALNEKDNKRGQSSSSASISGSIASTSSAAIRSSSASISSATKKPRLEAITNANIDADEVLDDSDDSDSDESEDDTQELLAELNRIKRERAQEEAKRDSERKVNEERIRMENILSGNPLLNSTKTEFKVKRRWDEDVVFKNCARSEPEGKEKPFINDTLRSEFHKKFMEKYIH
ncbi:protein CWC15 homolog [Oppia nitens]|uniref:protein CWC15 homolog n=1 Tax=Oppia nitens TaxID=1686743 RepID=UPI0023DC30E3|nr:protein CWC15 homolog [Oppia nitens]